MISIKIKLTIKTDLISTLDGLHQQKFGGMDEFTGTPSGINPANDNGNFDKEMTINDLQCECTQ